MLFKNSDNASVRNTFQITLFTVFQCFFLLSCIEEEPAVNLLTISPEDPQMVVEGFLTTAYKRHQVQLSYSRDFTAVSGAPDPIVGASLNISSTSDTFELKEVFPGTYLTDSMAGTIGQQYTLVIETGGQRYEATDEIIPVAHHDTIRYIDEETFFSIPFRPHQFGFATANRFDINVFLPDSVIDRQTDLPAQLLENLRSRTFTFYTHPQFEPNGVFEFAPTDHKAYDDRGYWVRQSKYSLSEEYYAFLRALFSETDWRGGILDTNPGEIPTNVHSVTRNNPTKVLGFFATMAVDELVYPFPVK